MVAVAVGKGIVGLGSNVGRGIVIVGVKISPEVGESSNVA
jgi:hypothetical protein